MAEGQTVAVEEPKVDVAALVEAGIEAKDIEVAKAEDSIVKTKDAKGTEHSRPYRKLVALTPKGMALLSGNSVETMLGHFNYAYDLSVRGTVRAALVASLEGPDKAIKNAADKLVAAEAFGTFEEAKAFVVAQRTAKGLPV